MKPTTKPKISGDKSDNVLPAYCNPPNPCPIGYTGSSDRLILSLCLRLDLDGFYLPPGEDGCREEFENTASFSRNYQASQDCMCDTEHMFDCPATSEKGGNGKNRVTATANMVDTAIRKIMSEIQVGWLIVIWNLTS